MSKHVHNISAAHPKSQKMIQDLLPQTFQHIETHN